MSMRTKVVGTGKFIDGLEMCDEIIRLSKLVNDPIAYVEAEEGDINTVTLCEDTLSDKSKVYSFRLSYTEDK